MDPLIHELRLLCRDEVELISKRTELVNQLQAALHEYYPAALEAFEDWTTSPSWSFVQKFPTPELLQKDLFLVKVPNLIKKIGMTLEIKYLHHI